jgi:hypothetical protein
MPDFAAPEHPLNCHRTLTELSSNPYQLPCASQLNTIESICSLPTSLQRWFEIWSPTTTSRRRLLHSPSALCDILSCLVALLCAHSHTTHLVTINWSDWFGLSIARQTVYCLPGSSPACLSVEPYACI